MKSRLLLRLRQLQAFSFILCCFLLPIRTLSAANSSEEMYYELEARVFDSTLIKKALESLESEKIEKADSWPYLTASLAVLISGYKIGDWYTLQTFEEGTADRALTLAAKAMEVDPKNSQSHAHYARLLILKGEYEKAWTTLNEAYRLNPDSFYPWYFRGIIAEKKRDAERAQSNFDEAERRISYDYQANLLNIHRQKVAKFSKQYDEQERLLKENIKNNPNAAIYYGNYGTFLMTHKRYDEAILMWEKSVKIAPTSHALEQLEKAKEMKQAKETSK